MEELNVVTKKQKKNFTSIIFLIVVVVSTLLLHFYNSSIETSIEKIKMEISSYDSNIKEVEKDKKIQIFTLLELNDNVIRGYKLMNKIPKYINHLRYIETKYSVKFTGFSFNNLELSSRIEIISDDKAIAYQKTRDFLKNYRKDPEALFNLWFVNQIEWMDKMKFSVKFKVKG